MEISSVDKDNNFILFFFSSLLGISGGKLGWENMLTILGHKDAIC